MIIKVEDLELEKLVFDHADILRDYLKGTIAEDYSEL